jgi:hypothetical protein
MLVAVDHFNGHTKILCVKSTSILDAAEWLYEQYAHKGVEIFQSDNGKPFVSAVMGEFLKVCAAKAAHSRPYNPSK